MRSLLAAVMALLGAAAGGASAQTTATLFVAGRAQAVPAERLQASGLLALCEAQVQGSSGVLRLAVSADSIEALRREPLALEIVYSGPRRFTRTSDGRAIEASRLLIPLAGKLAGTVTTIFVGNPDYGPGPLRNNAGTDELARAAQSLRAELR